MRTFNTPKDRKNNVNAQTRVATSEHGDGSMFFVIDAVEALLELPVELQALIQRQAEKIDAMMRVLSKTELLKKNAPATRLELDIDLEIEKFNALFDGYFNE